MSAPSTYLDEVTVRTELTRVFQVCHECRRCESSCTTFPSLFELIERREDHDAGRLTPAEQDAVVDSCVQCNLCAAACPYSPGVSDLAIDVPRLVIRAVAMQRDVGITSWRSNTVAASFGRANLVGRMASAASGLANRIVGAAPGSRTRRVFAWVSGVSAARQLRLYRRERFSSWFDGRLRARWENPQGSVAIFPTCLTEYRNTDIGAATVGVYERNGIECSLASTRCCGAPLLHSGELERFGKIAATNVRALADDVRAGRDIVVSQPGCGAMLRSAYVDHVPASQRADAELIASHTVDTSEYLMRLHRADDTVLDTDFTGPTVDRITTVGAGHLVDAGAEFDTRDLLRLTGSRVRHIRATTGVETPWGLRAANDAVVDTLATRLVRRIETSPADAVSSDNDFANAVLSERLDTDTTTGTDVLHPMQIVARSYGLHGH